MIPCERSAISRRPRPLVALVLVVVVAAACSSDNRSAQNSTGSTNGVATTSVGGDDKPSATSDDAPTGPIPKLELERVDVAVDAPIAAIALPGTGALILAERAGRVRIVDPGDPPRISRPLIDISSDVSTDMERGLLGIALNPSADRLFLSFTNRDGDSRLVSYDVTVDAKADELENRLSVDTGSKVELLAVKQPFANHNGGHIEFGPDAMLYFGLGDGGGAGDPNGNAQNRGTLLGKLLRLDTSRNPADGLGATDNPFVGESGAKAEIWATGLRNPWRFSFDPDNGDLWVADVGQDRFEEIDRATQADGGGKGANFGWNLFEGDEAFKGAKPAPPPASEGPFVKPIHVYEHGPGCSVTGGVVYRGTKIPGLVGRYIYSDFCDGTIRAITPKGSDPGASPTLDDLGIRAGQPVGFATDSAGELYVLSLDNSIYRLRPVG